MNIKKTQWLVTVFALLFVFGGVWWVLSENDSTGEIKKEKQISALYTGKEETVKVKLFFVHSLKTGFAYEETEIFLTASRTARVKQVLKKLFQGPTKENLIAAFPSVSDVREVFLDGAGLCVVDLTQASVDAYPGGTTAEYQSLYTLFRTLIDNFPDIQTVQIMVEGQRVPSLAGHLDIMDPLTKAYF